MADEDNSASMDDVLDEGGDLDDEGNYPLSVVPDTIEPGVMMLTLWTRPSHRHPVPFDFGFDWDGAESAIWNCSPGKPSTKARGSSGTADWSNGTDLELTYSLAPNNDITTVLEGAAPYNPTSRDEWVSMAAQIYVTLRQQRLL